MSYYYYYFKVVASPDGQWQTRRGARALAAYRDFNQALTRAPLEVDLHRPSELVIEFGAGESQDLSEWVAHSSGQPRC
jgi:hypothetical protein